MTPQAYKVLTHLRRYRTISATQAMGSYGILRLAARVHELREAGEKIECTRLPFGAGKHIGFYHFAGQPVRAA